MNKYCNDIFRICYYDDIRQRIVAIGGSESRFPNQLKFGNSYYIDVSGSPPFSVVPDSINFNGGSGGILIVDQTVVKFDNIIYIVFGLESNTADTISETITTYDYENNIWNTITTNGLPLPRENTCVLGLKNYKGIDNVLMVIAGNPDGQGFTNDMYYLDVTVGTWILDTGSLPTNRNGHSCLYINDTIYVVAGSRNNILYGKPGTLFEIMLDPNNQELRTREYTEQRSIYVRDDINQTDLIYIMGGTDSSSNSVEIIDIIARERVALYWMSSPHAMSKAKRGHCLVSDGFRLFVIAGFFGLNTFNEVEYTNSITTAPTITPTMNTLSPTQETSNPTKESLMPTSTPTGSTDTPSRIPTGTPSATPTETSTNPTLTPTSIPSETPTLYPSGFPSITPSLSPTLNPTNSPSISCDTIKVTSLYKSQNGVNTSPVCTSLIPCDWELTYQLQNTLINNRPWFKSITNDVNIQYNNNQWIINLDLTKELSLSSGISYPPNDLFWTLSTNNQIQYRLRIECTTITAPGITTLFNMFPKVV